jgi:hypothetical protein
MIVKTKKGMDVKQEGARGKSRGLGDSFYTPGGTSQRGIPEDVAKAQNRNLRLPKKEDTIVNGPKKTSKFHHLFRKGLPKDG